MRGGVRAGDTLTLQDLTVNLSVPGDSCTNHKYLLVGVLPAALQPFVEEVFQDNYYAVPLPLKCQGEWGSGGDDVM